MDRLLFPKILGPTPSESPLRPLLLVDFLADLRSARQLSCEITMNDSDLLRRFCAQSDHDAFGTLVQRYIDFVYAAALRHMRGGRHQAEDVTQQVFIDLAGKASRLTDHPCLLGWLYASTRFNALSLIRREDRRSLREQEAMTMQTLTTDTEPQWDQVRGLIDDALQDLDEDDRQVILMRFFDGQKHAAIGEQLGLSENAVQKRADRALDFLNGALAKRGVKSTSAALAAALAEASVASPALLAQSVTTAALVGSTSATTFTAGATKVLAGIVLAGIAGFAVGDWDHAEIAAGQMDRQKSEFVSSLNTVEAKLRRESARADRAEADTAALLNVIEKIRPPQVEQGRPAVAAEPQVSQNTYIIQRGDTLATVAKAAGVSVEALRSENEGYNFARMQTGQQIVIPAGGSISLIADAPEAAAATQSPVVPAESAPIPVEAAYVVLSGDTATKIAAATGQSLEQLQSLNPTIDWSRLRAGQTIRAQP